MEIYGNFFWLTSNKMQRFMQDIYIYILVYKYCNSLRANGLELKNMVVS